MLLLMIKIMIDNGVNYDSNHDDDDGNDGDGNDGGLLKRGLISPK